MSTSSYFVEDIEIRGKVYIKHSVFNSLNKLGNQFFNPRNAVSVSLSQLDAKITSFVTWRKINVFITNLFSKVEVIKSTFYKSL